ncbi:MAG: GNAT family N-acetyltransferase [Myxococcales bacterium]|nr:GNAT family N-acetyltransferase [Myxococcales bacterium]
MREIVVSGAEDERDLQGILALQSQNLEAALTPVEVASDGFVTVQHDLALLLEMNQQGPHVIAKHEGRVVGYALVMARTFDDRIAVLKPMIAELARASYHGAEVNRLRHFIMGQICVGKAFRGQGLFANLYHHMRQCHSSRYELVVTEVSARNHRSLRAHQKVDFQLLHSYRDPSGEPWELIAWDWS